MPTESKRKLLHYRRAEFLKPSNRTLQSLLEESLQRQNTIGKRSEVLESDDDRRRFINTHRAAMGMQFGNLVMYAGGQNHHTLAIDPQSDELDIEQIAPPKGKDGRHREFLESILYYGIKDNHVVILQSSALRSRELELHFNWLLSQAGLLDEENAVFINNYAPQISHEKIKHSTVKSVKLSTPLYDHLEEESSKSSSSVRFKPKGEGIDILNLLAPNRLNDFSETELQDSSNLEVLIEVTYKRQTDHCSQNLLNRLTTALHHASEDDIRIELKGAGVLVGSELQLKSYKTISTHNGLVEPTDLFNKMFEWLIDNLEMGYIDP